MPRSSLLAAAINGALLDSLQGTKNPTVPLTEESVLVQT
jgi:hypothetical protein